MIEIKHFISMDVESVGLHGVGFAVGAVEYVDGVEVDSFYGWAEPHEPGLPVDAEWVRQNVRPHLGHMTHTSLHSLREAFWVWWRHKAIQDPTIRLVCDVPWPVEANFLSACIRQCWDVRAWDGPYPIIDVASVRAAAGLDPLGNDSRLPNELPQHNALTDARQSGRLFMEAMRRLRVEATP